MTGHRTRDTTRKWEKIKTLTPQSKIPPTKRPTTVKPSIHRHFADLFVFTHTRDMRVMMGQ